MQRDLSQLNFEAIGKLLVNLQVRRPFKSLTQSAPQFAPRGQLTAAVGTRLKVSDHVVVGFNQELIAEIRVSYFPEIMTVHLIPLLPVFQQDLEKILSFCRCPAD